MKSILKLAIAAALEAGHAAAEVVALTLKRKNCDHRKESRSKRRKFDHVGALNCIERDYLGVPGSGEAPLLSREFQTMFRVSRTRFQCLMEDVMNAKIQFYLQSPNIDPNEQTSIESKLLLPLKTYAYGVPPHTFMAATSLSICLNFILSKPSRSWGNISGRPSC